ncbi:hypothetical protein XhyaCFBP1156_19615 [Xanthomonas hyacinthi]|uniref:Uncharacterized protein n=1 Tax=Xanthomonas hyacinthi TaxID=56455 RepID=A0A2S7EQ41_9XANT|nr:hypothetical protein Y886_24325 [Xanthomonas hyacinthi DSM 19077]PPU95207.1 hypothetical protein XhyaCFBP1156_19615 [Xanthomonas hyacinthi]
MMRVAGAAGAAPRPPDIAMDQPLSACRRANATARTATAAGLRGAAGVGALAPLFFAYAPLQ